MTRDSTGPAQRHADDASLITELAESASAGDWERPSPVADWTALDVVRQQSGSVLAPRTILGGFIEELVGINDRLFLTAALRGDRNSAFGQNLESFETYPKVGASWVISDEGFFPKTSFLSSLRLRSALGQALLQPGTTAAIQFYNPVAITDAAADVPGFTFGNLGNADLKPERTREIEVGFDAEFAP